MAEMELVRRGMAAISEAASSRDVSGEAMERALACVAEDFEFRSLGVGQTYRGHDGLRRWIADMHEVFADVRPGAGEPREVGDCVVLEGRTVGTAQSGVPLEWEWVWIGRVEDGLIREAGIYQTEAEALAAMGVASE